ncbi:MAG: pyruvate formate-lyase, partial [Clostridia bacterium]|nr:pyruvate formate-lyase [Clostridia bacterium]
VSQGARYRNYGIHGAGLATAVDALAAVDFYIYRNNEMTKTELLEALAQNYDGYDSLYHKLRYDAPKFGNNDAFVNEIASRLLTIFANALEGHRNDRGGIFRAGTGSAMYYVTQGKMIPATADGRKAGEGLGANYSPSLFARCKGPVSVILSFTAPDLVPVANGGPLTLELHDTMFRSDDSIRKTALLVKSYIQNGGHQLQLNAVNREMLLDAQKHPERYRNLIVRVWGWSGYFVELEKEYQDHIIARCAYVL